MQKKNFFLFIFFFNKKTYNYQNKIYENPFLRLNFLMIPVQSMSSLDPIALQTSHNHQMLMRIVTAL